jgi:hypothetical protein
MRAIIVGFILSLAGVATPVPAHASSWNFRVLLDGREVGQHVFSVRRTEGRELVTSEARFDVRILMIPAFRYDHRAVERWDDGCLRALDSWTVTNGERIAVVARTAGESLTVTRPEGRDEHRGCLMSFAYWDTRILQATRLLNSQTGELMSVEIRSHGSEPIEVLGRQRVAERHRIAGEGLQIDLWYADGRWVALEALAAGGRVLRYELADEVPS